MRPSAGTPYLARVPETQLGSPQAPEDRKAAIVGQATPGVQAARHKAAAIGPAAADQYGHNEPDSACQEIPRRPVGRELYGVFLLAAESPETSIRC